MSYNIKITYFGIIKSISSWSKISRNIIKSLLKLGVNINIYERKGFLYDNSFELPHEFNSIITNRFDGDIIFTFEHPKNYIYLPNDKIKVGFLVYEFTTLPQIWVDNINKYLDIVFVPSYFTYDVFIKSGVLPKKIKVLRYGIEPEIYYPGNSSKKIKRFLTISSPHRREGLEYTLKSFLNAFHSNNDVILLLKMSYLNKTAKPFEINANKTIEFYKKKLGERLVVITKKLSEHEMGDLYRSCDCYFSLSKSESFGLCFLEALACKKPILCINYSGQKDFLDSKNAVFVNYKISKTDGDEYEKTTDTQYIAYPDIQDATSKLISLYNKEIKIKPEFNYKYYSWNEISKEFLNQIINLKR